MLTKLNFYSYFCSIFIIELEEEKVQIERKEEEEKKTQSSHISDNFLSASARKEEKNKPISTIIFVYIE